MRELHLAPWRFHDELRGHLLVWACIGWNAEGVGFTVDELGREVGARFPTLLAWWGNQCFQRREKTPVTVMDPVVDGEQPARVVWAPVVPLLASRPSYSWRGAGDWRLLERTVAHLAQIPAAEVPLLGMVAPPARLGLEEARVVGLLRAMLRGDRYVLLRPLRSVGA